MFALCLRSLCQGRRNSKGLPILLILLDTHSLMRYAAEGRDGVEIQNRYRLFTKLLCQTQWIFNNYKNLRGTNTVPLEQLCLCMFMYASPGQQLFWCLYPREGQAFRTLIVLCQCVAHFIQHRSLLNSYTAMRPKMYYKWVVSMGITRPAFLVPLSQKYKTVIFRAVCPGSRLSNLFGLL